MVGIDIFEDKHTLRAKLAEMCGMRVRGEEGELSLLYLIPIRIDAKDAIYWLIIEELRRMETSSDAGSIC